MTYLWYLRTVMFRLSNLLPPAAIANLDKDLLLHIGAGWRKQVDPHEIARLIYADFAFPPLRTGEPV